MEIDKYEHLHAVLHFSLASCGEKARRATDSTRNSEDKDVEVVFDKLFKMFKIPFVDKFVSSIKTGRFQ